MVAEAYAALYVNAGESSVFDYSVLYSVVSRVADPICMAHARIVTLVTTLHTGV